MSDIIHTSGSTEESIILFEISGQGVMRGGFNTMEMATRSAQGLSQAMGAIQTLANRAAETINQLSQKPSEFELEFGVKIDAEAGAVITKASDEGNLRVKLVWRKEAS